MARKELTLPLSSKELSSELSKIQDYFHDGTLGDKTKKAFTKPFVIVTDEELKCKRIFFSEEDAKTYFDARADKAMTDEIAALAFTGSTIPGDEQYKMAFNIINQDDAATYGSPAYLRFQFSTADTLNSNRPIEEAVEIYFTFTSDSGTKTVTQRFNYIEETTYFEITEYLEPGVNNITLLVTGLSSGLSVSAKATHTAVHLPFTSSFDITADRQQNQNFGIPYYISGSGTKDIEFVIDGEQYFNDTVYEGTANKTYMYTNRLAPGFHTLQMRASTVINGKKFTSEMLYFEFVINGVGLNLTTTVVQVTFAIGTEYFLGRCPGLLGEQYVDYTLLWAYFSTSKPNAIVLWKTKLNGIETVVGSRAIDEMEGTVGVMPDPVRFQPDTVGDYLLYAYLKDDEQTHIGEYTINVVANTAGLMEASPYTLKLTAKGRSNDEPIDTISDWSYEGFKTTFNEKMTFDGLAGYTGNTIRFDNGATGIIDCKPFAVENSILANGCSLVFQFMTRNVEDENIPLIEIGDYDAPATAYFAVYGKRVLFRPSNGESLTYEFASEEETHLALTIHPKTGVTDNKMMFFIFNGIEAPGKPYGDTAVFNIGSYADKNNTNGMIKIGDASGKAAIDIYGIRVYNSMLSMWQGMNNYMIDKGGDVAKMMRKNNIFSNANFNTPDIKAIKEQYRVLEVIGNLGMLETSNKKENFFGSVRYSDPFNPKFNFERLDGGAYIETAGQSRLEDLMAKSFHLDLNTNDTVATYQDGKLCHKNRFIFAEGNIPENGVRIDLSGADSSICRNASHMKMVNKYYPYIQVSGEYVLRTPPQKYALSGKWSQDMADTWGNGTKDDYPWKYNINFAPDSVPIIVVWHLKEEDPITIYGLAQMTEEKKASYANGNHSIYLKQPLDDGTLDPFDRYAGKSGQRGWDNEGVIEVEYVNPSDLTNNVSIANFENETTRDYSFELCFPKKKDMEDGGTAVWNTFLTEFLTPLTNTYGNQSAFNDVVENILYLPSFAMYYNKVMDKKMNDSLCRNMHVIRYNMGTTEDPKWLWWAKWWDADVCCGLFQSNAMGVEPDTDRQTKDINGDYVMAGHDMWLWNALEKNNSFKEWSKVLADASFKAGWSATTEIEEQDKITDAFSEATYNLDGLLKFLQAYRKGNDYMVRMQGSSVPYRHGFIKESYNIREAQMAIGQYAARSMSFRAIGATHPCKVTIMASAHSWFGIGTVTTNIITGLEHNAGDVFDIQIPQGMILGRDFLSIYGADKIKELDISDFLKYQSVQINLGNLTAIQKLYIGYKNHEDLIGKFNRYTSVSFTNVDKLTRLTDLSIMGLSGLQSFPLDSLNHLKTFIASGSGLKTFHPADGTKFEVVELPDSLQTIEARNVSLGNITFWKTIELETEDTIYDENENPITTVSVIPHHVEAMTCPSSLLTLSLIGMGDDEGAHELVHRWCMMLRELETTNPNIYNNAQITYRSIEWGAKNANDEFITTPISKEDLFTLARIPESQRKLTGYVFCNSVYTAQERKLLTDAFGSNVFNYSEKATTLVCDGVGDGLTISADGTDVTVEENDTNTIISVLLGTNATFIGAGFPISGSNKDNYRYSVFVDGEWLSGNDFINTVTFGSNKYTLNWKTGLLTTVEHSVSTETFRVLCEDCETHVNGEITLKIVPRTYPNKAEIVLKTSTSPIEEIDGEIQITAAGSYWFEAIHKLILDGQEKTFSGTMKLEDGGKWTLVNADDAYVSRHTSDNLNPFLDFMMQISSPLPKDDLKLTLRYESNWKGGAELTAEEVKIVVVSVVSQLVINSEINGNPALFKALENANVAHANAGYFSSMEVKMLKGVFNVGECLGDDKGTLTKLTNGSFYVPQYLKNVTEFIFKGCFNLVDVLVDATKTPWAQKYDLEGTSANIKVNEVNTTLSSLKLGSPKTIEIVNPPVLSSNNLTSEGYDFTDITLHNLAGGGTFKKFVDTIALKQWIATLFKQDVPVRNINNAVNNYGEEVVKKAVEGNVSISNDTSYIFTDYVMHENTAIECKFKAYIRNTSFVVGLNLGGNKRHRIIAFPSDRTFYYQEGTNQITISDAYDENHVYILSTRNRTFYVKDLTTGVEYSKPITFSYNSTLNEPVALMCEKKEDGTTISKYYGDFYYCKFINENTGSIDRWYIPVKKGEIIDLLGNTVEYKENRQGSITIE